MQEIHTRGKLIYVITDLSLGGAESQLADIAIRVAAKGWMVQVVSMLPPGVVAQRLTEFGIPVLSLKMERGNPNPLALIKLARIIRSWEPDVVHSFMVHANLLARLARPLAPRRALICSIRNVVERGRGRSSSRLREIAYRFTDVLCDLTVQNSEAGLARYVKIGAVPENKIRFIPNGVDTQTFRPDREKRLATRAELGLDGEFVWLAVGRLEASKDYPTLLRAFSNLQSSYPTAILLIAGAGSLQYDVESLRATLQLENCVRLLGVRQDILEVMNSADAFVSSSRWEGMPMTILESASCALPIAATDVGDIGQLVLDGETGFLAPHSRPDALAAAMDRLMQLPAAERERMGERGRIRIKRHYELSVLANDWDRLYREFAMSSSG